MLNAYYVLGVLLYALHTFYHLMHIKPVTDWNLINGSCYYRVAAIWEVSTEKVNFNQKFIGGKLGGGWWIVWKGYYRRWEEGTISILIFFLITTKKKETVGNSLWALGKEFGFASGNQEGLRRNGHVLWISKSSWKLGFLTSPHSNSSTLNQMEIKYRYYQEVFVEGEKPFMGSSLRILNTKATVL